MGRSGDGGADLLVTLGLLILVMFSQTIGIAVITAVVLALLFGPPLVANALYYRHCRKLIDEVKTRQPDYLLQIEELEQRGGVASRRSWHWVSWWR